MAVLQASPRYQQIRRKYKKRFRLRNKLLRLAYLVTHPCVDCGECDPRVLDFDHRGKKFAAISKMAGDAISWAPVEKEIAACDVRCANCHRRKTLGQLGARALLEWEFWEEWRESVS